MCLCNSLWVSQCVFLRVSLWISLWISQCLPSDSSDWKSKVWCQVTANSSHPFQALASSRQRATLWLFLYQWWWKNIFLLKCVFNTFLSFLRFVWSFHERRSDCGLLFLACQIGQSTRSLQSSVFKTFLLYLCFLMQSNGSQSIQMDANRKCTNG